MSCRRRPKNRAAHATGVIFPVLRLGEASDLVPFSFPVTQLSSLSPTAAPRSSVWLAVRCAGLIFLVLFVGSPYLEMVSSMLHEECVLAQVALKLPACGHHFTGHLLSTMVPRVRAARGVCVVGCVCCVMCIVIVSRGVSVCGWLVCCCRWFSLVLVFCWWGGLKGGCKCRRRSAGTSSDPCAGSMWLLSRTLGTRLSETASSGATFDAVTLLSTCGPKI